MRIRNAVAAALLGGIVATGAGAQAIDPEQQLKALQFTPDEIARAGRGEPIARILPTRRREELAVAAAVRIDGDPGRLAQWIENIEHFRSSAQLGTAKVIPLPATSSAFAALTLDPADLEDLRACRPEHCELRVSTEAQRALQAVTWNTASAAEQASTIFRDMLAGVTRSYVAGQAPQARAAFHDLVTQAAVFRTMAPEILDYFDRLPASPPPTVKTLLYWSSMPGDRGTAIAVHHLALSRRSADDIVIADRIVYASRYFDAGAIALTMSKAPAGGFYLMAGSRLDSPDLAGLTARVARRKIEGAALDAVRMYTGWIRESFALTPKQ